ncbi:hypothetical protein VPHK469_0145 [Vibrio phage K469]
MIQITNIENATAQAYQVVDALAEFEDASFEMSIAGSQVVITMARKFQLNRPNAITLVGVATTLECGRTALDCDITGFSSQLEATYWASLNGIVNPAIEIATEAHESDDGETYRILASGVMSAELVVAMCDLSENWN